MSLQEKRRPRQRGFTIVELMVASTVSVLSLGLVYTALIGMQHSTRNTLEQVRIRQNNQNTIKKLGRFVMEASKAEVRLEEAELGIVHLWKDDQVRWTPETTEDDTEGVVYFDETESELHYRKDVNHPEVEETIATQVEKAVFEMVGNALFVELTMNYDVDQKMSREEERVLRKIYVSYAVRNNPRVRIGASR